MPSSPCYDWLRNTFDSEKIVKNVLGDIREGNAKTKKSPKQSENYWKLNRE